MLEPFIAKWKQFGGMDYLVQQGKYRSLIPVSGEDFDKAETKKTPERNKYNLLETLEFCEPFELASMRSELRRAKLTVLAPRHFALLAGTQISRVQTIPFNNERL